MYNVWDAILEMWRHVKNKNDPFSNTKKKYRDMCIGQSFILFIKKRMFEDKSEKSKYEIILQKQ